jgi:hypothetical protein
MMGGKKGALLTVTKRGFCCACELEWMASENQEFYLSRVYHTYLPNNFIFFLAIDDNHKRFAICVQSVSRSFRLFFFDYSDLIDFEYSENKTIANVYNSMMISIYLSSLQRPHVSFYLVNAPVQFGSKQYNLAVRTSKEIFGLLHYIRHSGKNAGAVAGAPEEAVPLLGQANGFVKMLP